MMKFKIAALPADKVKRELGAARKLYAECYGMARYLADMHTERGEHRMAATCMKTAGHYTLLNRNACKILQALSN